MDFTPWQLFVDLGFAAVLLLIGQLIRAQVSLVQRLFLPASVVGGFLGLALGPNGADLLLMSRSISTYPGILIALVFATLPFAGEDVRFRALSRRVMNLWSYSSIAVLLQWGVGILFSVLVLQMVWRELDPGFGALLAAGFVGGHGTAAAIGVTFEDLGWPAGGSLAMTSATVGILSAVIGGILWVKWGARSGNAAFVAPFEELPRGARTGLLEQGDRDATGRETLSSHSLETLVFHFSLIATAGLIGYFLSEWSASFVRHGKPPVFCTAYIAASGLHALLRSMRVLHYVDRKTISHIGGGLTDLLVVFGIASIVPAVIVKYSVPLGLLMTVGILLCGLLFRYLGPQFFSAYWFERSLFTWGWITGVTALGIALLRIVDPKNDSRSLVDFGLAYLFVAPIEIGLLAVIPTLLAGGHAGFAAAGTIAAALMLVVIQQLGGRRAAPG